MTQETAERGQAVAAPTVAAVPVAREAAVADDRERPRSSRSVFARVLARIRHRPGHARTELIASLYEVASAVSSKLSIEEILDTVVDEAKRLVRTQKAVLCLIDEQADVLRIDQAAIVVRGRRGEYPEEWWFAQLEGIAEEVFASDTPQLTFDHGNAAWILCVPVKVKDRPIGLLAAINSVDREFSDDQIAVLAVLGAFAGSSIENTRLVARMRHSMLASERSRISKEMHDGLAQELFSISLGMELCKRKVAAHPEEVTEKLGELQQLLSQSIAELRRYIYDLRPVSLDRLGLTGALEFQIAEVTDMSTVRGRLVILGRERSIAPAAEACLYRVAQEAINNIVKHARARYFRVSIRYETDSIELVVEDNGRGFDLEKAIRRAERGESLGVLSMQSRVEAEGGSMEIASKRFSGTTIRVELPC